MGDSTGTRRRLGVSACVMLFASACGGSNQPAPQQPAGTGLQEGAPWPMFRHDLQHSGRTPHEGPSAPRLRWRFSPAAPDTLSNNCPPAIAADGTIYIASSIAVNAITAEGTLKWTFPVSERCHGSPLIAADGTIYVGGAALHALTPEGTERWQYRPMQDELGGSPAIATDGTIYICSKAFGLDALAPDGSVRWTFPIRPNVTTSPAVAKDGTIYVAGEQKIFALTPSGQKKWEAPIAESGGIIPVIAENGDIYALSREMLSAFSPAGALKWRATIANLAPQYPPAVATDGTLWLITWEALFQYGPDGAERQRLDAYAGSLEMPVVDAKGVTYFASANCTMHAVDSSGTETWTVAETPAVPSCGSPVMDAKGTLYFTSPSGGLIAVGEEP
jgi:outer membrane protein assembly factor BamB